MFRRESTFRVSARASNLFKCLLFVCVYLVRVFLGMIVLDVIGDNIMKLCMCKFFVVVLMVFALGVARSTRSAYEYVLLKLMCNEYLLLLLLLLLLLYCCIFLFLLCIVRVFIKFVNIVVSSRSAINNLYSFLAVISSSCVCFVVVVCMFLYIFVFNVFV